MPGGPMNTGAGYQNPYDPNNPNFDPNYDPKHPKTPPGFIGPSANTQSILDKIMASFGAGNPKFEAGWGGAQSALGQPSGFDTVKGMLPQLFKFMGGGDRLADQYIKTGLASTRSGAVEGAKMLGGNLGAGGNLGGTFAGVQSADLISQALNQANTVKSQGEQLRESTKMGRLQAGGNALLGYGGLADTAKSTNVQGNLNLANLGLQSNAQDFGQLLGGFGATSGLTNQQNSFNLDRWSQILGIPKSPSGIDVGIGGLASIIGMMV